VERGTLERELELNERNLLCFPDFMTVSHSFGAQRNGSPSLRRSQRATPFDSLMIRADVIGMQRSRPRLRELARSRVTPLCVAVCSSQLIRNASLQRGVRRFVPRANFDVRVARAEGALSLAFERIALRSAAP
jgi:hypothetical protein